MSRPVDPDLPSGTQVGEYIVKHKLAAGGMGQIYAGVHPIIGKEVAIKVLNVVGTESRRQARRFLQEAQAVNRIDHPSIVDIFAYGSLPDGRPYFVMELLHGETLEDAIGKGSLPAPDLGRILRQLCEALTAAHAKGVVHRDLKPENLWIVRRPGRSPDLKILDFGIAKDLLPGAVRVTDVGDVLGTPHYMAPEQALGRVTDERTDLYAVGIILYRIFSGVLPFDGDNPSAVATRHATETPIPLLSRAAVSPELDRIVMACLRKQPAERPQTAEELWRQLGPALGDWLRSDRGKRQAKPILLAGGMLVILVVASAGWLVFGSERRGVGQIDAAVSTPAHGDTSRRQGIPDAGRGPDLATVGLAGRRPSGLAPSTQPSAPRSPTFRLPPLDE